MTGHADPVPAAHGPAGPGTRFYKRADGGPVDPVLWAYRVEIILCCPRHGDMLAFHRLTLPGYEHEPVMYDRGMLGKSATLAVVGQDWAWMEVGCTHCRYHVQVNRQRLEAAIAALWAPLATRRDSRVWDSPR